MAQQNLPNGIPPQMVNIRSPINTNMEKPPMQFNGVHSSHSSRDSSPSTRPVPQMPNSKLPPARSTIPSSQLPPSRSPLTIAQKMGQLSVNSLKMNTSTPNQTLQNPSELVISAFSPINSSKTDSSVKNQVFSQQQQQQQQPLQPQGNRAPYNSQGQTRTLLNQGIPPYNSQVAQNQPFLPNNQTLQSQIAKPNNQAAFSPIPQQQVIQQKGPASFPQIPQSQTVQQNNQSGPSNFNYNPAFQPQQFQRPVVSNQNQAPPQFSTIPQPKQVLNNNPVPQGGYQYNSSPNTSNPPPPAQFKTNLHSNRYPQSPQQPQQPNVSSSQFYQQPQPRQNSVTHQGFNKLWGHEHLDLLQTPNVLPREKVLAPRVYLGNELLDSANCSPDVFRCTMTKIPESNSLLQKSRLPLGILIHPFKDLTHLPVIQCNVIVRCRACRTYINPFVFFVDTKRWKCNLCYRINELPEEFQFDPVSKTYGDPTRRPEIKSSTIEYIAPAEYMLRPPQPAVYLFLFDISRLAIESGYLQSACAVLLEELKNLPGDARTQVGIIAYDSALHFFALGEGLSQPHEMTVLEIEDVFLPCPDNLLVNLKDRIDLLTDLLTQLPTRFNNSYDNNSALGSALQAAHKMMGATGGRVTVFQASLPNIGPGALTSREDPSQRAGTEVAHLNPANDFYKRLALECSGQQVAVDLFVLNSQYVDMATISGISRFSGGCIHHFPLFKASRMLQNERFERCFRRYLSRKIGFEAVMRIRCTRGLSIHTFHGNFFVRSTDLLSLPNVSPDAGFGMQVSIDENLSDVQTVCFQAALLYTSSKGERRIRVHTLCLPICPTLSDVINAADQQCIMGLLAKMAVDRSMQSSLSDARDAFINVAIDILSSYKLSLNMGNGSTSLYAPQCLQLLPLYISALLKSTAFRTGTCTRLDDRVKAMIDMKTKPLNQLIQIIYPDLYPVHNLEEQPVILNAEEEPIPQPPHLQLTARCLDSKGAFLMDTGEHMILLIAPGVSPVFLNEALGVRDYVSISDEMYELPIMDNLHNQRLHQFINHLNDEKPFAATLHVIRDNSPNRIEFFERLIEDRLENALSYHEFMQHLKTQVK